MVHKVPLFPVRQNRDLVKIHKVNRLYALGLGSCTACFIVKISQKFSILDFIVAIHLKFPPPSVSFCSVAYYAVGSRSEVLFQGSFYCS